MYQQFEDEEQIQDQQQKSNKLSRPIKFKGIEQSNIEISSNLSRQKRKESSIDLIIVDELNKHNQNQKDFIKFKIIKEINKNPEIAIQNIQNQKYEEEAEDFEFLNKKKPVRKFFEYKLGSFSFQVIIQSILMLFNIFYLILIPFIYTCTEQSQKALYIYKKDPKKLKKIILGFVLDFVFAFSYQFLICYLIYFIYCNKNYKDLVAFHWSLENLSLLFIWLLSNIFSSVIPIEYKIIKNVCKVVSEKHQDLGSYQSFILIAKKSIKELAQFWKSDDKQDLFEQFLNLGYLSTLLLQEDYQQLWFDLKKYRDMDLDKKNQIYERLSKEIDIQMNMEKNEIILMKADQKIENDINNTFQSRGINKPQSLTFSFIEDSQADSKKEIDNQFFLNEAQLNALNDQKIFNFREARKFLVYEAKNKSFYQFMKVTFLIMFFKQFLGFYTLFNYYIRHQNVDQQQYILIGLRTISTYYLIQMIYKIAESYDLELRLDLIKIIRNVINVSKQNNFIYPSSKHPNMKKWDISDSATISSWNQIRICAQLMHNHYTLQQEKRFKILFYYLLFILYYFIGLTDTSFFLKINFEFLNNPIWISVMVNDAILLILVIMRRINYGSMFNDQLKDLHEKVLAIRNSVHQIYQSPSYFYHYQPKNQDKYDFAFFMKTKILSRIEQQEILEGKVYTEIQKIQLLKLKLKYLKQNYNTILEQIHDDMIDFPVYFINTIKSDTREIFGKIYIFLLLYFPILYTAIKKSLSFQYE